MGRRNADQVHAAWLALTDALTELAHTGRPTPCQSDPDPFTSDERADRREAEQACTGCVVRIPCRAYADTAREPAHVWGGRDRAPGLGQHTRKAPA